MNGIAAAKVAGKTRGGSEPGRLTLWADVTAAARSANSPLRRNYATPVAISVLPNAISTGCRVNGNCQASRVPQPCPKNGSGLCRVESP
jgi:hypothetical protein